MSFTKLFIKLLSVTTLIPILLAGCNSNPDPLSKLTSKPELVFALLVDSRGGYTVVPRELDIKKLDIGSISLGRHQLQIREGPGLSAELYSGSMEVLSNSGINFVAAYPNVINPVFVIISSFSSGTCCGWTEYRLALLSSSGDSVVIHELPISFDLQRFSAFKSNDGSFVFSSDYVRGKDSAGDPVLGSSMLKQGDRHFMRSSLYERYPGLASLEYGSELFSHRELRSKLFPLSDSEIGLLRTKGLEDKIRWFDGSSLFLCSAPIKGEWNTTEIIIVDLETEAFEFQSYVGGRLIATKGVGSIRSEVRKEFSATDCWDTRFRE